MNYIHLMKEHHTTDDVWLNDVWTIYFHDPADSSWTLDSYRRLGDIATVAEFWQMQETIAPSVTTGMFFAMREHVFPCWDDKSNIEGGCVSIKVSMRSVSAAWELLFKRAVGETMMADAGQWDMLNGISIRYIPSLAAKLSIAVVDLSMSIQPQAWLLHHQALVA